MYNTLIICLIIFLLLDLYLYNKETFEPSNVFYNPTDEQREIYLEENKKFDILNIINDKPSENYDLYSGNSFEYNEIFKKIVINYINEFKKNSIKLSDNTYNIVRDIYNIYISNSNMYYKFDIDIVNITKNVLHTCNVIMYKTDGDFIIYSIINIYDKEMKKYEPNNFSNLYRIQNTLYLMDPYLTSGYSMNLY